MPGSSKVIGDFYTKDAFEEILKKAESKVEGKWEKTFVGSLRVRFKAYGSSTYLSERQQEILEEIANKEGG